MREPDPGPPGTVATIGGILLFGVGGFLAWGVDPLVAALVGVCAALLAITWPFAAGLSWMADRLDDRAAARAELQADSKS